MRDMKKTVAKIIIVFWLALGLGRSAVTYTTRGADYYKVAKQELRIAILDVLDAEDKRSDLTPYLQTPAEQLSWLYTSGVVIGTWNGVNPEVLQERLQYYQESKNELWWE